MFQKFFLAIFLICGVTYSQSAPVPVKDYGLVNTRACDTALVTHKFIPIILSKTFSAVEVSALVSIFPTSTDSVWVCFDDTSSNYRRLLVTPNTPRQFVRRATRLYVKGSAAGSIHIDVEY